MNILGIKELKAYLRILVLAFITVITQISGKIRPYDESEFWREIYQVFNNNSVNQLKFTRILINNGGF